MNLRTALSIALLFFSRAALAIPWFVEDDGDAEDLQEALEALWPGTPVEIVVGDAEGEGFQLGVDSLVLRTDEEEHTRPVDGEIRTAVALARSWLRELESTEGWVPKPDNLIVAPDPQPPPAPFVPLDSGIEEVELPPDRGAFHMAVGAQDVMGGARVIDGIRIGAGASQAHWTGEMAMFLSTGSATEYSGLDKILSEIQPETDRFTFVDLFTVTGGLRYYLGSVEPQRKWSGGPSLIAGAELRSFVQRQLIVDEETLEASISLVPNSQKLDIGPVLGIGIDLWMGAHAALRLSMLDRIRIRNEGNGAFVRQDFAAIYEIVYRP